ncbi:MAG: LCP family protein [Candidatus Obscuribacterales bacterium]|nr:LCP family protein [Candidatus Obscuribacterales bacterium]
MKSTNWGLLFIICALTGIIVGYVATLILRPTLLPPALRWGGLIQPTTVLLLGTDVVYNGHGRHKTKDLEAFTGRSDTIMFARLDPYRNSLAVLSIPRDSSVRIPGHGIQKINAANALGGPELACATVSNLVGLPVDHYVVLNVRGLVDLVDELGGITIDVPKKMRYRDRSAGLNIDLSAGEQLLDGTQAMGFVRFRHDGLGDIGRVQRQEIFIRAVLDKAMQPSSWTHIPKLLEIAGRFVLSDLDTGAMASLASFVKAVPTENQTLVMLPGRFSGTGDWDVDRSDTRKIIAKMLGSTFVEAERKRLVVSLVNNSSDKRLTRKVYALLRKKGYRNLRMKGSKDKANGPAAVSEIIAQRGNPEDALVVKSDLGGCGTLVNASVGDIDSYVTVVVGDDLQALVSE